MMSLCPSILVIDDEPAVRKFLEVTLAVRSYAVSTAATGRSGLAVAESLKPDVIILDLGLPDMDGVEVVRSLRQRTQTPIIILSVRGSEADKIGALDAGADDYLTKPFSIGELSARLRVALRRAGAAAAVFSVEDLTVDTSNRSVTAAGREVELTPTEYNLLDAFVANAGKVLTRHYLLLHVWGTGYEEEFHMLHVNISNLRRKIEPDPSHPRLIITEQGVGYRLRTG